VSAARIAIAPDPADWAAEAVRAGGGTPTDDPATADALVWVSERPGRPEPPERLGELLRAHSGLRWVQLPFAGVEAFAAAVSLWLITSRFWW